MMKTKTSISQILLVVCVILETSCSTFPTVVPTVTPIYQTSSPAPITPTITASATFAPTLTATPDYRLWSKQSFSLDGMWVAIVFTSNENGHFFVTLDVEKTDGSVKWQIEKFSIESKPPITKYPWPVHWSKDGTKFFYTHQGFQDGCFTYFNGGTSLFRLDLQTGKVEVVLDEFTSEMKFSSGETKLAYVKFGKAGLKILDVATGVTEELEHLYTDVMTDQYGLVWSPDNRYLAFTIMQGPCDMYSTTSIVLVNVAQRSQRILVKEDKRNLETVEWIDDNRILVKDMYGQNWYLNPRTGELIAVSQ